MPNFGMAEQYGIPCTDLSDEAWRKRESKICSFFNSACNKAGGVCSITDGNMVAIVCPRRFRENNLLFSSVAEIAFDEEGTLSAIGEVAFLQPSNESTGSVGSIDNLIVLSRDSIIEDWCGIEVQAVYFSGSGMTSEIKHFTERHEIPVPASRRPDFRSSATKRLLPQLEIKIPTLRRWGKKMFVAVDKPFFDWMPQMKSVSHISNADICWMVFDLDRNSNPYRLVLSKTLLTTLEDSREGLIAGVPPALPEFEDKISLKLSREREVLWTND